ncbi:universal stress protein [Salinimicrobium sp. CDJ15-81-2]|nr:universal stress protein [Salinimicrobium nanhaiense]
MESIIVSTDFSKEAENAIEYAGALAQKTGMKLVLFNSFSLPLHTANSLLSATGISRLEESNRRLLKQRAEKLRDRYGVEVAIETDFLSEIEDKLENLVVKSNASLVVMGMAAKSVEQDIFGNTTTSAIFKLKYPVLAVPASASFGKMDNILFACDDIHKVEKEILEKIKYLNRLLEARLEVFHVEDTPVGKEGVKAVPEEIPELEDVNYSYKNLNSENVIMAIKKEIEHLDAKLLIMVPRRYGFWQSVIHRSKTRVMASGLSIPLLTIPQLEEND